MNNYQLWCLGYCCFGAFFYGYDSALTTSIIAYPEFLDYFAFDSNTLGALGSVYYAGICLGAIANAYLPDKFGRKRVVQLACVISLVGAALQTGATNLALLLVGRVIGGLACGLIWSLCPMYASELSPPHMRGRVGALYNINLNISYAIAQWMGLAFSYISGGQLKWRIFLGLQLLIAVVMFVGTFWIPESPRWLVVQNKDELALATLRKLHESKSGETMTDGEPMPFYQKEFNQIQLQIRLEQENPQLGIIAVMKRKSYRKRLTLIVTFFAFQQLTGVNPLQNYQVILYGSLGIVGRLQLILVGVWGTTSLIAGIPGLLVFDRWGRRKNFFISQITLTMASVMLVAFWASYEKTENTQKVLGQMALWSMFMWLVGFGWIQNAFGYTYTPEIMPMEVRAVGMAAGYATKTALTVVLVQVTPLAVRSISWRFFMIFVIADGIFLVLFYFFYPETANVPLEEVAAIFGDDVVVKLEEAGKPSELLGGEINRAQRDAAEAKGASFDHIENRH